MDAEVADGPDPEQLPEAERPEQVAEVRLLAEVARSAAAIARAATKAGTASTASATTKAPARTTSGRDGRRKTTIAATRSGGTSQTRAPEG